MKRYLRSGTAKSILFSLAMVAGPLFGEEAEPLPAVEYRGVGAPLCSTFITLVAGDDDESTKSIVSRTTLHREVLVSSNGRFMRFHKGIYNEDLDAEGTLVWVAGELRSGEADFDFNQLRAYQREQRLAVFQRIDFADSVKPDDFVEALESVLAVSSDEADTTDVSGVTSTSAIFYHGNHYDSSRCIVRRVRKVDDVEFPRHDDHDHED